MSTEKYPWPQFQLTAFVLDELKPEVAAQIQAAAERDPALAAEIAGIRAMVGQLTELYKHETAGIEPTVFAPVTEVQVADDVVVAPQSVAVTKRGATLNWTRAVGLLAMAASLLIAAVLSAPALRTYFASSNDVIAKAADEQPIDLVEAPKVELAESLAQVTEDEPELVSEAKIAEQQALAVYGTRIKGVDAKDHPFSDSLNDVDRAATPADGVVAVPDGGTVLLGGVKRMGIGMGGMQGGEGGEMGMGMEGGMGMGMGDSGMAMGASGMGMGGMGGMGSGGMGMGGVGSSGMRMEGEMTGEDYVQADHPFSDNLSSLALNHEAKRRSELGRHRTASESNDRYAPIYENPFKSVESEPLSTFSIDVDTASYVKTRQFLLQSQSLPPANAVRVEEFINYFEYDYAEPEGDDPFAAHLAVATCPWRPDHKLVRIALQAKKIDVSERPQANIVFLLDVSGSMAEPNKLPLVKESMRMLIRQLGENDRVAMVVYAGAAGCVLESTTGDKQALILGSLDRLNAGGSTNGGEGIQLAYDIARDHFIPGGVNRVILCTDGDFNVGTTSTEQLVNMVVKNAKSKVFLTVLGFGMGNTNDAMMEQISNKGNGIYNIVDSQREAKRQMIKQLAGNLMTVAKDVKIQVEFNPTRVASYRLIGYENRMLAKEDFDNDKKDAGEIGAGHRVTALYEIEPIGAAKVQPAEGLRYQKAKPAMVAEQADASKDETNNELLAVKLRYKQPEGDTSKLLTFPLIDANQPFAEADTDFKWAASVAQFGMLLRHSTHKGDSNWISLVEAVEGLNAEFEDDNESRRECLQMIRTAASLGRY